eukprot:12346366-Alexandrium_andersonii.AAC.1
MFGPSTDGPEDVADTGPVPARAWCTPSPAVAAGLARSQAVPGASASSSGQPAVGQPAPPPTPPGRAPVP